MGLTWDNPQAKSHSTRADVSTTNITWKESMKSAISDAVASPLTVDLDTFATALAAIGVTIKATKRGYMYKDTSGHRARDFYQRINSQTGEIKSTRGLGRAYTPNNIAAMIADKVKQQQASQSQSPAPLPAVPHNHKKEENVHDSLKDAIRQDRVDAANKLRDSLQAGQLRRSRLTEQQDDERETTRDFRTTKTPTVQRNTAKPSGRSNQSDRPAKQTVKDDGPDF